MAERRVLGVLPLRGTVLFPEEARADSLYAMGVIVNIGQIQPGVGSVQLSVTGQMRGTAVDYHMTPGGLRWTQANSHPAQAHRTTHPSSSPLKLCNPRSTAIQPCMVPAP